MTLKKQPFISVIIPCYNEELYIHQALDSIINNNYSHDKLEILVVDGLSIDNTRNIVKDFIRKYDFIKLIDNNKRTISYGLNLAIKYSKGDFILRADAHSEYPDDYISNCVESMIKTDADNVGGIVSPNEKDSNNSILVKSLTTHWFGVGNSTFRLNPQSKYVDTVPFGFFNKEVFKKCGFFDERLIRNQDYEFNRRILKFGGKIWLNPKIKIYYNNKTDFKGLINQAFITGKWNVWMWRVAPYSFKLSHSIPLFFLLSLLISFFSIKSILIIILSFYFTLSFFSSIQQSIRYSSFYYFPILSISFFIYHLIYGIGEMIGFIYLIFNISSVGSNTLPWKGAKDYYASESV